MSRSLFTVFSVFVLVAYSYGQSNEVVVHDTVYVCTHDTLNSRWAKFDSYLDGGETYVKGVFSVVPPYRLHFYDLYTILRPTIVLSEWKSGDWSGYIDYRNTRVKIKDAKIKIHPKKRSFKPRLNLGYVYSSKTGHNVFLSAFVPVSVFAPFMYAAIKDAGVGMNIDVTRYIVKE